jgi:hypothetical protein
MGAFTEIGQGEPGDIPAPAQDVTNGPSVGARKPWHAPRFMLTDIANTNIQGGPITDANLVSGSS